MIHGAIFTIVKKKKQCSQPIVLRRSHLFTQTPLGAVVDSRHARRTLRLDEQRLRLTVLDTRLTVLSQLLNPALDPSLTALNLRRLRLQHNIATRGARRAVIDLQTRRDANLVRQRWETRARQTLVQKRRQQTAVHNRRVSAQLLTQESNLHQSRQLLARVRQAERRDFDPAGAQQHAAGQVVRAHGAGDLEVRSRLDDALLGAQAHDERVVDDVLVDGGGLGRGGLEHCEGFGVGGRVEDAVDGVGGGGGGHDEAGCEEEGDEGGGDERVSGAAGFRRGSGGGVGGGQRNSSCWGYEDWLLEVWC